MFKKAVLSIALTALISLSLCPNYAETNFSGDYLNRWSAGIYSKWIDQGAIQLDEQNRVYPSQKITGKKFKELSQKIAGVELNIQSDDSFLTRGEVALMLYNALNISGDETVTQDVAISKLREMGIINGNENGAIEINKMVTNEEAVAMLDNVSTLDEVYQRGIIQNTKYGKVKGITLNNNGALAWLGVPYAKAPVGLLRWKAPVEPEKWQNIKDTTAFSDKALQVSGTDVIGSEDCLNLNIYRPNTNETNLPVMVFLHGGNNQTGTSQDFQGELLAKNANCIIVAIDYRLGALGWLNLPALKTDDETENSGNFGLLDIHQSLNWVRDNIKYFGGNPYNVTLAGQSAGGRDVMACLISPLFKGDFQKAYALSGGMTVTDPKEGEEIAAKAIAKLVVEDGIKSNESDAIEWLKSDENAVKTYLYQLPSERLANLMTNAAIRMSVFPHLFADGVTIPKEGFEVFKTGEYNQVPVMLGSCASEFSVFAATDPMFVASVFGGTLNNDESLMAQYNFANHYGSMLYTSFNAERSAEALSQNANQPKVYAYRFSFGEDASVIGPGLGTLLGANHGIDMDFVTGKENPMLATNYTEENYRGRNQLKQAMQTYIKNFLHTGNPNGTDTDVQWNSWSNVAGEDKLIILDADKKSAKIEMTNAIEDEAVFELMDKDNTISDAEKKNLISTVMSGRFFSESLDKKYNQ